MDRYYLNTTYVVIALVFLIGGILIGFIAKVNAFIFYLAIEVESEQITWRRYLF